DASGGSYGAEPSNLSAPDQQRISPSGHRRLPEFPAQQRRKLPQAVSSSSATVRPARGNRCSRHPPPVAAKRSDKRARFSDRVPSRTRVLPPAFAAIRRRDPSTP